MGDISLPPEDGNVLNAFSAPMKPWAVAVGSMVGVSWWGPIESHRLEKTSKVIKYPHANCTLV